MNHSILICVTVIQIFSIASSFHSIKYNRKFIHDHSNSKILPTTTKTTVVRNSDVLSNHKNRLSIIQYEYCNSIILSATNNDNNIDDSSNNNNDVVDNEKSDFTKFQKDNNDIMNYNDDEMILKNINTVTSDDSIIDHKSGSNDSNEVKSISDSSTSKEILWDVYICQLKNSKERGADATLGAFIGLSPTNIVSIHTAYIHKSKGKGPTIRCVQRNNNIQFEVNNVDSVDKVYTILTKYMNLKNIDPSARECFKYNYKGNAHLDKNEITQAIQSYNMAISTRYKKQEGIILVMRATAYLKRAFNHRNKLKLIVSELEKLVPNSKKINALYGLSNKYPIIGNNILYPKFIDLCRMQDNKFQQIKYRHGLYENSLLHATKDSLRATQLLPNYAKTWLRAGDSLAELRKYKESATYYEKALELDDSLEYLLKPMIKELEESQIFLDNARASGWSDDTLRISLDVAG